MSTAFLSLSFAHRHEFQAEIRVMREVLATAGVELLVFVEKYEFAPQQAAEMMQTAVAELQAADYLIAEVSYKAIGVGIEVGYMAALGRPIIYIRRSGTERSTTVAGLATHQLVYETPADLESQLQNMWT